MNDKNIEWVVFRMRRTKEPRIKKICVLIGKYTSSTPYLEEITPGVAIWSTRLFRRRELCDFYSDGVL